MLRWIFIICMVLFTTVFARPGKIIGVVQTAESGEPLAGANVTVTELKIGTTSDEDGAFVLDRIPPGDYTLVINYLGYKNFRAAVAIDAEKPLKITVALEATPLLGNEISVISTRAVKGETPAAFATLSNEELQTRYYAQDIPVLLSELPSTTFYSENGNGVGYNYMSIRGFDQRRISVMINGVPQNDPEDHNVYWVDFPDFLGSVEDIQVQRGAGSAFYGPPAIGGSVNIITQAFSPERKLTVYSGGGSYGTSKFSIGANTGLINNHFVINARVSRIKTDGYRESSALDFKSYFIGAAYFGEKSSTRLQIYGGPIEDELAYLGISKAEANDPERRKTNDISDPREIENFNQPHFELINSWQLTEKVALNNTLFYIRGYGFFDYQGNWAPFSYFRLTSEFGFDVPGDPEQQYASDVLIRAFVENDQGGWFPNLTWQHSRGQLTAGSEIRTHRSLHWGRIQDGSDDLPRATSGDWRGLDYIGSRRYYQFKGGKDIISPYVHSSYRLNPKINLNAALQFVWQRYKLFDEQFLGTAFNVDYTFLNPRVGINYSFSPQTSVFASYARTSREPRLKNYYDAAEASTPASWGAVTPQFNRNADGSLDFNNPLVKPENLNDFELGFSYLGERAEGHINLFYMDFRDEIVKSGQLDRFGQPITGNAARSLHAGIELSGRTQLTQTISATGNMTFSHNELKEYSVFVTDIEGNGFEQALDGNVIAGFPNFLANARVNFQQRGFTASLAMQHVGKFYTDNFENEENSVDAYTVFHGVFGYEFGKILNAKTVYLQLHVRNIFDNLYIAHGEGSGFFPAATRNFFVNAKIEF